MDGELLGGATDRRRLGGGRDMKGNAVGAAVVVDDNGSPFLVFDWHHPYACHGSWSGYYLGKRMMEGKEWRLTDEERGRLGMGKTFKSVERLVKKGSSRVYEEDEGEDDDDDDEEDDDDDDDDDDVDTGGEDAVSEDVGEKRKASDDETGAKKRRRA